MKLSEFWACMEYEFGAGYAPVLARDLVLGSLGHVTAAEALDQGVNPRMCGLRSARSRRFRRSAVWVRIRIRCVK